MGIDSTTFLNKILKFLSISFWIIAAAKILTLPLYFIFPIKLDFSFSLPNMTPKYQTYRLIDAFKLKTNKEVIKKEVVKNATPISNMILKGVYKGENGGFIIVSLKDNPTKENIVGIGENFQGYKLTEIYPKKVIFERDGKEFVLYMQNKKDNKETNYITTVNDNVPKKISITDVNYYTNNFDKIFENIKINDVRKDGKLKGFVIQDIKKNSIFDRIGLKKGDVIIKVNDKPLRSYGDAFYFYNLVKKRKISSLKLTILRNKEKKDIEYEIY